MIFLVRNLGERKDRSQLTSKSQIPALNVIKGDMDMMFVQIHNLGLYELRVENQ